MLGSSTPFSTQVRMARAGLNWTQHDLASRARSLAPVRSSTSRPIAGSRVAKLERKSATPWRMLALISMGIARFGFGATRGQLRRRSSKPRRSVAHDLRVAVRRRPRPGNAYTGSLVAAGFSRSIDGGSTGRRPPQLPRARTHGSGIPGRGAAERNERGDARSFPDVGRRSESHRDAGTIRGDRSVVRRTAGASVV